MNPSLDFIQLYSEIGKKSLSQDFRVTQFPLELTCDSNFKDLTKVIYSTIDQLPPNFVIPPIEGMPLFEIDNPVLIGFTGGKDSTYQALQLQKKGLNPILVYIEHINHCYPSEKQRVESIGTKLHMPVVYYNFDTFQRSVFTSNPIKNGVILSILYELALKMDIHHISLGTHRRCSIKDVNPMATISDSSEFIQESLKFLRQKYPSTINFYDIDDPISIIYTSIHEHNLLSDIQSCMGTHRFRESLTKRNLEKYSIKNPLPNRCYSCYKCATETLILHDLKIVITNQSLINHCVDILRLNWPKLVLPNKPPKESLTNDQLIKLIISKY